MFTGLTLVSLFDKLHTYSLVFSNAVKHLVRHLVVNEKAVALDRKYQSGSYEKISGTWVSAELLESLSNNSRKRFSLKSPHSPSLAQL